MKKIFLLLLLVSNLCFSQVNLTQGLMAYYPFSGNANDVSGNNNNPVFNNATLTADRFGNANSAYHFDGTSNYMKISNNSSINSSNTLSLCAWVRPQGYYAGTCHGNSIMMKGDADYLPGDYLLRFDDNAYTNGGNCSNPVDIAHQNFYGIGAITPSPGYTPYIQTNQWYSVIVTYDGTTAKLYINCVLKYSAPQAGLTFTNTYDLFLGRLNDANYPYWFNGDLDEVRIYNRALTTDEVNVLGGCPIAGTTISNVINNYTPVLSLNSCDNKIAVEDASAFNTSDTVVMMQMKGAIIDTTNTATFGTITDYKNSGNYEFNYVKSKTGNIIELKNKLTRQYDIPTGKVQLIRAPYYNNVNVNATLTCLPWDGNKGGVLILKSSGIVILNANIDVSGKGFNGAAGYNPGNATLTCFQNYYNYPLNSLLAAQKGESITTISNNIICGKGNPAAGGGGGVGHNSGGGGGGNAGNGGFGGYQLDNCGNAPFDNRGIGGSSLNYNSITNKIFMGSGGGAGHADNAGNIPPAGGNGGGIAIIIADQLFSNGNKIITDGNNAVACSIPPSADCHDGMGGGGAGGTVLLNVNKLIDNTFIENKGGKGTDMIGSVALGGRVGPGGGGGGGLAFLKNASIPVLLNITNTGGANGVLTTDGNNPWGATPGSSGANLFNLIVPVDSIPFKKNIDSVRMIASLINCNIFDFKGLAYINANPVATWQWYFGDGDTANTQNTSHTYSAAGIFSPKLLITDTNGCKDSVITAVTSTIFSANAGNDTTVCFAPSVSVVLHASAGASYSWSPAAFLNNATLQNPMATITGSTRFYVTITDFPKCIATDSVMITIAPSNLRYPTLSTNPNQPLQLQARDLGGNNYSWLPPVGLSNSLSINPVFNYGLTQEYKIQIATPSGCQIVDTQLVTIIIKKGIYVPKAFSPNGDGVNDRLYPILVGIKQLLYFRIYNRWGNLIFETNSGNPASGWDGKFLGNLQPVETYTWIAEGIDIDNIDIKKSGSTLLIR